MAHFQERFSHISHRPREESPFPPLPQSLEPLPPREESPPAAVHTILPYNTPYLGLRARLSQVWLNRWTILLLLILVRILLAASSIDDNLATGRREALSACTGVESMGSAMASMPHYMAQGVNEMTAKGIEHAVSALEHSLLLALVAIEEIAVFVVHLLIGTYVCLLTFAIKSSVGTVLDATEDIMKDLNSTLKRISGDIQKDAKRFTDELNSWASKLNSALSNIFGSDNKMPTLSLGSLDELKNIQIPSKVTDGLETLQKNLPDFKQAQSIIDNQIRGPFDSLRNLVNNSLTVYEFDRSVFPVPEKETLTFCSDNPTINNFFDHLKEIVTKAKNIVVGIVAALAVLVMIPMGYREWWRYRTMRQRAYMLSAHGQDFDPVDIVQIASRPYSSTLGLKAAATFKTSRRQILVRWFFAYITSTTALFVLALGMAGLLSALGQYVLLRVVQVETPALAHEVGQFANIVVQKLDDASTKWAVDANSAINSTEADINQNLFGWVINGTQTVNDTLNLFVDQMTDGINDVFGGTPLEGPMSDILNCLVLLKVRGIEKGLTWAHDNAHITLPKLPNDTFSLGAAKSVGPDATSGGDSFLSDKSSVAADKITNVVVRIADQWRDHITKEALISGGLVGIWLIVVLIGAIRTLVMLMGRSKGRGEGGDNKVYTGEMRQRFSPQEKGREFA